MTLRLNGDSGYVEIAAPSSAGSNTLVLPDGNGTSGQYLQTDGSGALSWQTVTTSNITYSTAQATTSGTTKDFTDVPSGVKKITVILDRVSTAGVDRLNIRLSTGGTFLTSGYNSSLILATDAAATNAYTETTALGLIVSPVATNLWTGMYVLTNITGNKWVGSGTFNYDTRAFISNGVIDVGGTIDGIRFFSDGSALDNGNVNIMYEV
jgi:hypothetical protein